MGSQVKKKIIHHEKTKLKIGDEVVVISGKAKNTRGKILAMNLKSGKVLVQGANMKTRMAPPSQERPKGGPVEMEFPMHLSNVQYWDAKSKKPSRLRYKKNNQGKKIRVTVKSGAEVD